MSTAPADWPGPIYLDASALVKLFVPEEESDALNAALRGSTDVVLSDLSLTEMASAIGRRRREGAIDAVQARRLHREAAKLAAACHSVELTPPVHRHAERLLLSAAVPEPLRTLDALHVALAHHAQASTFVTYDARLRRVAESLGLLVVP